MRRIVLALVIVACASPAFAVQDRYGPPRIDAALGARISVTPAGPSLNWAGKSAPPQSGTPVGAAAGPAPIAPWAQRLAPLQSQANLATRNEVRVLPPPKDRPQPYAMTRPVPTAAAPNATERPRIYSVGRQYGEQPDPVAMSAPPRGAPLALKDLPNSENLGRSQAPLDDGRSTQAVIIPDTKQNAASNRISRYGL